LTIGVLVLMDTTVNLSDKFFKLYDYLLV
jgi:hypothetical protein